MRGADSRHDLPRAQHAPSRPLPVVPGDDRRCVCEGFVRAWRMGVVLFDLMRHLLHWPRQSQWDSQVASSESSAEHVSIDATNSETRRAHPRAHRETASRKIH